MAPFIRETGKSRHDIQRQGSCAVWYFQAANTTRRRNLPRGSATPTTNPGPDPRRLPPKAAPIPTIDAPLRQRAAVLARSRRRSATLAPGAAAPTRSAAVPWIPPWGGPDRRRKDTRDLIRDPGGTPTVRGESLGVRGRIRGRDGRGRRRIGSRGGRGVDRGPEDGRRDREASRGAGIQRGQGRGLAAGGQRGGGQGRPAAAGVRGRTGISTTCTERGCIFLTGLVSEVWWYANRRFG